MSDHRADQLLMMKRSHRLTKIIACRNILIGIDAFDHIIIMSHPPPGLMRHYNELHVKYCDDVGATQKD